MHVRHIDAQGVDKLYDALQKGMRVERRLTTANKCMLRMARAWKVVHRLYPKVVPLENPFNGVELEHGQKDKAQASSRAEAYALHKALLDPGEPHLAAAPLICFEWHQRPENVIEGHLTWADYRRKERPNWVRIEHHKTGKQVDMPLADRDGPLFPELTAYLDGLEGLGIPIVPMKPKRVRGGVTMAVPRPFLLRTARNHVRKAARAAGLPDYLTMEACRHGGLTELGDAEVTEQGGMALSGHSTPEAFRLYRHRTEKQRMLAARKRRIYLGLEQEQEQDKTRKRTPAGNSE
jgi:integrase